MRTDIREPPLRRSSPSVPRVAWTWLVFLALAGPTLAACLEGRQLSYPGIVRDVAGILMRAAHQLVAQFGLGSVWFWGPLAALLLAERLWPAKPEQKTWCVGVCQDVLWFLAGPVLAIVLVFKFKVLVRTLYDQHLQPFELSAVAAWPVASQVVAAVLVGDFVNWLIHLMKHRVRVLWYFHAVHHSQPELNAATDHRVHPTERVLSTIVYVVPLALVGLDAVPMGVLGGVLMWHTAAYHANLRTNYGILRYVLVTPQSHRVHHGRQVLQQGSNYGVVFSIWDRLFGTQYPRDDEYPDTGLEDAEFPADPTRFGPRQLLAPLQQLVHPFALILRRGV